jgi:hypothetical protein
VTILTTCLVPGIVGRQAFSWRPIFNGRDLAGWEHVGPGRFVVEDGVLTTEGGMGLLWYTREVLGNAAIRVVYRNPGGAKGAVGTESGSAARRRLHRSAESWQSGHRVLPRGQRSILALGNPWTAETQQKPIASRVQRLMFKGIS